MAVRDLPVPPDLRTVDPAAPRRVLATSADGLLESRDGGLTFTPAAAQPLRPLLFVDHPPPTAGGALTPVGVDVDGTVWSQQSSGWVAAGSLGAAPEAFAAVAGGRYLAATADGVRTSDDGGRTWRLIASTP